ncbi:MAG: hypothetical protein JW904_12200 [Spirochaetales bacterium]|nr:hypothetical protein [Spirochaetales bacterium]
MKDMKLLFVALMLFVCLGSLTAEEVTVEMSETAPVFAETTKDAVLLRNKFTKGDEYIFYSSNEIDMDMTGAEGNINMTMIMDIRMNYTIDAVTPAGTATTRITMERIAMSADGMYAMSLDSDIPGDRDREEFKGVEVLLDNPFFMDVTPEGNIVNVDVSMMRDKLDAESSSMTIDELESSLKEMTKNTYMALPEKPVKAGDIYDAGTIEQEVQGVGALTVSMKYEVLAISKDKTQVLLKPIGVLSMEEANLEDGGMDGWILYDVTKGQILKSYISMKFGMDVMGMSVWTVAVSKNWTNN